MKKKFKNEFSAIAPLKHVVIKEILQILGNPHKNLKFIHIAGTNGKGSVCAFLQSIFTKVGLKTGKYISPNMINVCERISIDGKNITQNQLDFYIQKIKFISEIAYKKVGQLPTQFEIWTIIAFCYFFEKDCDLVILETGLGGEKDATNVIETSVISIITRISLDHTNYLGNSIEEIAYAKAGIIKKNSKVITIKHDKIVLDIIKNQCKKLGCSLTVTSNVHLHNPQGIYEVFSYKNIKKIKCGLGGIAQIENALMAIEAAQILSADYDSIRFGIENAKNIGRFEVISNNPCIIFDGAHNINGMLALLKSIKRYFENKKITFIMGFMKDKNYNEILDILANFEGLQEIRAIEIKENSRSLNVDELVYCARKKGILAMAYNSIYDAIFQNPINDIGVICGSLYLYKDFIECKK